MNILARTTGDFRFILKDETEVRYQDYKDIPEDIDYLHVLKFVPDIPPEPHTPEDHAVIHEWNDRLNTFMEKEREYWRNHAGSN